MKRLFLRPIILAFLMFAGLSAGLSSVSATTYINLNTLSQGASVVEDVSIGIPLTESEDVSTDEDLRLYRESLRASDKRVGEVNFTGEAVEVHYRQRGKLLALLPVTFTVRAIAHANGEVEVIYPWYTALTIDNKNEVETKARVSVDNALKARAVGSVRAEGNVDNPRFTPSESAMVASQLRSVLKASFEAWGQRGE